ncbi:hypothetical protein Pelo_2224 [Pelomyxa schiedti]|nr:hypothetical protein Pelo_2224 [Pelomyxa schiedti]
MVFGPSCVGKTTLVETCVNGIYSDRVYEGSIEPSWSKQIEMDDTVTLLEFLDLGCEQFTPMRDLCFSNANIVVLCYCAADKTSLVEVLTESNNQLRELKPKTMTFLVGLKMDLVSEALYPDILQDGITAAIKIQAYGYFLCSSKLKRGLNELCEALCRAGSFGYEEKPKKSFFSFFSKSTPNPKSTTSVSVSKCSTIQIPSEGVAQASISFFPRDIWLGILGYLDFPSLIAVSRTCRQFYHFAKTEPLWTNTLYNTRWTYPGIINGLSWKNPSFLWDPEKCFSEWVIVSSSSRRWRRDEEYVCFGPNSTILMANGTEILLKKLQVGDLIATAINGDPTHTKPATVICIWKCPVGKPIEIVTTIGSGNPASVLEITTDHPVWHNNTWCLPSVLGEPRTADHIMGDYVYNLVVSPAPPTASQVVPTAIGNNTQSNLNNSTNNLHEVEWDRTAVVGGVVCCTLGMRIPGHEDGFWGSQAVITWLLRREDFPNVVAAAPPKHLRPKMEAGITTFRT